MTSASDNEPDNEPDSTPPPKKRGLLRRFLSGFLNGFLSRVLGLVLWLTVSALALVLSVHLHLDTPVVREGVRVTLNDYASSMMMGTLTIGEIERISLADIVVRDVRLEDPSGEVVLSGERIELVLDLSAALTGTLRFSHAALDRGHLRLIEGESAMPTFLDAFAPSDPDSPPAEEPFHAVVDDMHLSNVLVTGDLLGVQGLRIEGLHVHGRMEFEEGIVISIFDAGGRIVAPWPFEAELESLTARIESDPHAGSRLHASVRTERDENGNRDHVALNLVYAVLEGQRADSPAELDVLVHADPVQAERLSELGFEWAEMLQGPAEGHVRFYGPPEDLRMSGTFNTAGGIARVRAHLPSDGEVRVRLQTDGLRLAPFVRDAPDIEVAGVAILTNNGEETTVVADLEPLEYEGTPIPGSHIEGRIVDDQFELDRATVHSPGGDLEVRGNIGFDGSIDVRTSGTFGLIQNDPLLSSLIPGARGRLDVHGRLRLGEDGTLNAEGRFIFRDLRYGPLHVRRLIATGHVLGTTEAPEVRLRLDTNGTEVSGVPLGTGQGRLVGGPERYQTHFSFVHEDHQVAFDGGFRVVPGGVVANIPTFEVHGHGQHWQGTAPALRLLAGRMSGSLEMAYAQQRIRATADWRFARNTEDHVTAEVANLELENILAWVPDLTESIQETQGALSAVIEIDGDLESQPRIEVDGHVAHLSAFGVEGIESDFSAQHMNARVGIDAQFHHEERGTVDLSIQGLLDDGLPLSDTWRDGSYEAQLSANQFDLSILNELGFDIPPVTGRADGEISASGGYGLFNFSGRVETAALRVATFPALGVQTTLSFQDGSLIVRVLTLDNAGELLEGEVSMLLDLNAVFEEPSLLAPMLDIAPWRASFRMAPRDLGSLPAPIALMIPEASSLRASASITVRGGAFRPSAELLSDIEWIGDLDETHCGQAGVPRVAVHASLRGGIARLEARGLIDSEPVLYIEASAPAPIDEWIAGQGRPELPPTEMSVYLQNVPLDGLPFVCEYAGGPLTAVLTARDVFTENTRALLDIAADELVVRRLDTVGTGRSRRNMVVKESPPFRLRSRTRVANGAITTSLESQWWNGGRLLVEGDVPLETHFAEGEIFPSLSMEAPLVASAIFDRTPLEVALFWLPGFGNVAGIAEGQVLASGPIGNPSLTGELGILHGQIELESLGQRLDDVEGHLLFEGDRITLQNFFASDGSGSLRIAGDVGLEGLRPSHVQLELAATAFPVRQEGSVIAALTGDAAFRATLGSGQLVGELEVRELSVQLPADEGRSPISLEHHPEIVVRGEAERPPPSDPYEMRLHVDGSHQFELLGEGISADLTAELDVLYRDPIFRVEGGVELHGGSFEVFGKRFGVERGWLRFDGGETLDPLVNLVAVHRLRSQPGETVTVTAGGRLSDPDIRFSSTITSDHAAIVALLVTGNVRQESSAEAGRQTADFLNGVLSGALTLTLREEFGAYIPNITVEGNAFGGNRFGGGWNLERLLPEAIREFILGMYVEGYINTGDTNTSESTSQVFGVRLELDFPSSVQNSYNFTGPTSWSADVTWTP